MSEGHIVIDGESAIRGARLLTLRSGLGLEIKGFRRNGRSCYSIIKEEVGLKGSKIKVYQQFTDLLNAAMPWMHLDRDGYR